MLRLLIVFVLLVSGAAFADELRAVMTIASFHLERGKGYCEFNPGLGVAQGAFEAGFYHNSHCRLSWYAGGAKEFLRAGEWQLAGVALAVTGYESAVIPAFGLAVRRWLSGSYGARLVWFPSSRGEFDKGVIGLQVDKRW